ncbi:MAG: 4Fe-4S binding protein [Spirochaetaceae bacterium]|nr:4Fe-4S binding protein [Spirochaetaceae bacterium]
MAKQGRVLVRAERCKGCYLCVRACPKSVLEAGDVAGSDGVYPVRVARGEDCVACGNCYAVCPDFCFTIYEAGAA